MKTNATNSYADLKRQIAELEAEAAKVRESEIASAKAQIREIMKTYDLTLSDLGGNSKGSNSKLHKTVEAKYRDTATGQEWTGRGRAPRWLDGKDKEQFLIK